MGLLGSTNFTAARAFQFPRGWQMVKLFIGNTMLSNNFAVFQDKIALRGLTGTLGSSAVVIDVNKMRVDAGVRHQTSWTFPHPGPDGQLNYFVGEQTVQKLTNKRFDRLACSTGLQSSHITPGPGAGSATGGFVGAVSTILAGAVGVVIGDNPLPSSVVMTADFQYSTGRTTVIITPGSPDAAALYGTQQVYASPAVSGTTFTIMSGTTALVKGMNLVWNYHIMGAG